MSECIFYKRKLFWYSCGIPTILCSVYLSIIATPRFVSQSVVRVYAFTSGGNSGGSISLGGNAAPGAYIYRETAASWGCFDYIKSLQPDKYWSRGDFFERYGGIKSFFLKNKMRLWSYYKGHVRASVDDESGLVEISVTSFDKEFSRNVNNRVMSYVREHLNNAGYQSYLVETKKIRMRNTENRKILDKDILELSKLQRETGMTDFAGTYTATLNLVNTLENRRIDLQSKISAEALFAQRSQELRSLEKQISIISKNIDDQRYFIKNNLFPFFERYKILSERVSEDLDIILMEDRNLQDLERYLYTSSYHVDVVEEPFVPSAATAPRVVYSIITIFLITFLLYVIIK